ncbi:MAG: hypothetical protein NZ958_01630, partial [Bacteroidia bacterium]|nr:hypothetical protein [Bacteroidia bacterium]
MYRIGLSLLLGLGWAQTILVDGTSNAGSFESANVCNTGTFTADGWTVVNGSQTNYWVVHTGAGAHHGSRAIYISTTCSGTPSHNYNVSATSVVHFYRDVTLPAG